MEPPRDVFKAPGAVNATRFQLDLNGKAYALHEGVNTIGRSATAVVNIKNLNVSHVHAIITVVNESTVFITDMKSANGTELDSQKLEPLRLHKLDDNARVKFANICGVFKKNALLVRPKDEAASQDVSQGFYAEATQPMFEDIHDMPTQVQNIHEMETQMSASRIDIHDMPTQMFETNRQADEGMLDVPPPQAFVDTSAQDVSLDYFAPSTSMMVESVASNVTVEQQVTDESDGCSQFPVGRVKRKSNPLDSPDASPPDECTQIPVGRVKRKPNPFDSPERSSEEPTAEEESQIPARPMPKKPGVFYSSSPTPEEEVAAAQTDDVVVKRKSIYALSSDSDTDIEEDTNKTTTANSSDVIPCTQDYSCLTESFNLQLDETQAQISVDDKENISMNVDLDLSNDEDEIVDETIYQKSPEASTSNVDVTCVSVKQHQGESSKREEVSMDLTCVSLKQGEASKRQEVSMDLTCVSVKQGESSKRQEISMDLTCASVRSSQEKQNGGVPETIPEEDEDEGQTQLVDFEPVDDGNNDVVVLAEDEAASRNESAGAAAAPPPAPEQAEERDAEIINDENEDDIYLLPTQCLNQSKPKIVAADEDLYFQPTQVLKPDAANAEDKHSDKEASQQNGIGAEETAQFTQGLDDAKTGTEEAFAEEAIPEETFAEEEAIPDETFAEEPPLAEEMIGEEKSVEEKMIIEGGGFEHSPGQIDDGKSDAIGKSADEQQTDEPPNEESNVIPETQATCSKDSRTVVVVSNPSGEDAGGQIDVEAGIATLFMNDNANVRDQSSGESVEDRLQMLFYTQMQDEEEEDAFACTQHLVKALEDSGAKSQDDSLDIPSTQTLVATLNKSDVCDDDCLDRTSSQPLTLTKDVKVRTYSKAASNSNSGGGSCSSDSTVVEMPVTTGRVEDQGGADRIEEIYVVGNRSSSASVVVQLDDGEDETKKAATTTNKSVKVATQKQSGTLLCNDKATPDQGGRNPSRSSSRSSSRNSGRDSGRSSRRNNEEEDEQSVEATPKPRQSSRQSKQRSEESVKETPKTKQSGRGASKQNSKSKQVVDESGDDSDEEQFLATRRTAAVEAKTATVSGRQKLSKVGSSEECPATSSRSSSRSSSKRAETPIETKQSGKSKQVAIKKVVDESGDDSDEEQTPSTRRTAAVEAKSATVSGRQKLSKAASSEECPATSSRPSSRSSSKRSETPIETKQSSKSKQVATKKVVDESGDDSDEEQTLSTRRTAAVEAKTGAVSGELSKAGSSEECPATSSRPSSRSSSKRAETPIETKQSSKSKQVATKKVVDESGDDSDQKQTRSTRRTVAVEAKTATLSGRQKLSKAGSSEEITAATSRSSAKRSATPIEPKPGTSKQLDETPKLARTRRTTPTAASLKPSEEKQARTMRSSKTSPVDAEEEERKANDKASTSSKANRTKRKTATDETEKPTKKKTRLYTDSSDEFEEPSPQASPKKSTVIAVAKTTKKRIGAVGAGAIEKIKVVVPKENEAAVIEEAKPSTGEVTKARRLSAHSRSVKNAAAAAAAAQQDEAKPSTSRKRSAKRDDLDEEAPPVKKTNGDTPERNRRKTKPKVIFTMMDDPVLESMVRQLGGSVVDSVQTSTVLVTGQVKRSLKLLMAVGAGKPICSPEWIKASKKSSNFLDPWEHILIDKEAEKKWDFSLRESLSRSQNFRLFGDYTFQICVTTAVDVLKGAIESCGGKVVAKGLAKCTTKNLVVVGTKDVQKKFAKILKDNPAVIAVEPEAIFDGTLRQELRLDRHLIK